MQATNVFKTQSRPGMNLTSWPQSRGLSASSARSKPQSGVVTSEKYGARLSRLFGSDQTWPRIYSLALENTKAKRYASVSLFVLMISATNKRLRCLQVTTRNLGYQYLMSLGSLVIK